MENKRIAGMIMGSIFFFFQLVAYGQSLSEDLKYQQHILYYINAYRASRHLKPLEMNSVISKEATKHSDDMAQKIIPFGHTHFDERIQRLYKQVKDAHAGAENVAYYKLNAKKLVEAWVASPGHRRNIEGNYNLTGIGIAHARNGWAYYTQLFLRSDNKIG